jgi:uncharacterized protein (TIGR00251 family)
MYIKVKVSPGSKKETFEQISPDHFKISVKEPAKMNLANKRVIELIARHFGISSGKTRIVSGQRSPNKILNVDVE